MAARLSALYSWHYGSIHTDTNNAAYAGSRWHIRISDSRITLDTLVGAYEKGATAEQIQDSFPSLSLRQIYGAIAYYLEHEAEVKNYLQLRRAEAQTLRHEIESHQDTAGFRARLRARQSQLVKS